MSPERSSFDPGALENTLERARVASGFDSSTAKLDVEDNVSDMNERNDADQEETCGGAEGKTDESPTCKALTIVENVPRPQSPLSPSVWTEQKYLMERLNTAIEQAAATSESEVEGLDMPERHDIDRRYIRLTFNEGRTYAVPWKACHPWQACIHQ